MQKFTFHIRVPLAIFCAGLVVTGLLYGNIRRSQDERDNLRLNNISHELRDQLTASINIITFGLGGANGVFAASKSVEHDEFRDYVKSRDLPVEFPGTFGFGFVEYVKREDIAAFIENTRNDSQPYFQIRTVGDHPDLFIIKYSEPEADNIPAHGFDIGSEKNSREAAETAMLSGQPTLTRRVRLLQDRNNESGFLFLKPVYRNGAQVDSPEARRQAIYGWVYAPFTLQKILAPLLPRFNKLVSINVYEGEEFGSEHILFQGILDGSAPEMRRQLKLTVGQQVWSVEVQPLADFFEQEASRFLPFTAALAGLLLSVIAGGVAWIYLNSKHQAFASRIAEGQQFVQGILDSANFSIIVTEINGTIRVFNRAASRMLGYSPEEVIGKATPELIHDAGEVAIRAAVVSDKLNRKIEPGFEVFVAESRESTADENEWSYVRKDGSRFPVSLSVSAMRNRSGEIVAFTGIASDITERRINESRLKERTEELMHAKEAAENAARSKSEFLANMSHEVRTPLASIIGFSESLIVDDLTDKERRTALETVIKNGNHLLGIINDILDFSKIEAGKLDVEVVPVDLGGVISDVINLMEYRAREKGLTLAFDCKFPLPGRIHTDPIRLKQILINLVGNAIKFTSTGGIKIEVSYRAAVEKLIFSVIDSGPGLSYDQKSRLFQAFSQADTSTTRKFGGTGLGLVISSQLAQKLGGQLTLESEQLKGSIFTVTISAGPVQESEMISAFAEAVSPIPHSATEDVPRLSGHVLIVEDGKDNIKLISYLLNKAGINFTVVENGALAVEAVLTNTFDLILMDVQMPVMDGYTATRIIRERGITVPIVALTANAMKSDIEQAAAAGCTEFLGKPFSRKELYSKLAKYLTSAPGNT